MRRFNSHVRSVHVGCRQPCSPPARWWLSTWTRRCTVASSARTASRVSSYAAHARLHAYLKELAAGGVLLALVSRNEPEDVERLFAARRADYGLALEDFVAVEVSWGSKADAVRRAATSELGSVKTPWSSSTTTRVSSDRRTAVRRRGARPRASRRGSDGRCAAVAAGALAVGGRRRRSGPCRRPCCERRPGTVASRGRGLRSVPRRNSGSGPRSA